MKYIYETKLGYFLALTVLGNLLGLPLLILDFKFYVWALVGNTLTNILVTLKRDTERWY